MSEAVGSAQALLVVTGPTASGKTSLGLELARIFDGELVGADSVQVYRGFDIGSSKPRPEELSGIHHHLLDVATADQPLDAVGFAALADAAIADIASRGRVPIVVGGSGLWLRALLRGLVALPPVDPSIRERLDNEARTLGTPALHARLQAVDPLAAQDIHPNDRVRVVRALEIFEQTGTPVGALRAHHALGSPRYRDLRIVLDVPSEELTRRIAQRTQQMLAQGLADEVRGLLTLYPRDTRALGSVGYREVVEHLCDGVSLEETVRKIDQATRIYARRQRTWLNNEPGELWQTTREHVLSPEGIARLRAFWASSA